MASGVFVLGAETEEGLQRFLAELKGWGHRCV